LEPPKPNELLITRASALARRDLVARAQLRIELARAGAAGDRAVLDREHRDQRLDRARGAERVAGHALGRVHRHARAEERVTAWSSAASLLGVPVPCRFT
jgi:hypothetical protein